MKNRDFIYSIDIPELNEQENKLFFLNLEFSVLTSLVKRGLLTISQAEKCRNILKKTVR